MKETWEYYSVPQDEDVMKSMLGERIDFLEKLVAKKDAAYARLKSHLETCQDAYDRDVEFKPDWDLLNATQESLREHMQIIKRQEADLALWDGREKVLCDLIDEKDAEIASLKGELAKGGYWSLLQQNAALTTENLAFRRAMADVQHSTGRRSTTGLEPHNPLE